MRAEFFIGISILWFLIGYGIRDLGSLGAAPPPERDRVEVEPRSTAPKYTRTPW